MPGTRLPTIYQHIFNTGDTDALDGIEDHIADHIYEMAETLTELIQEDERLVYAIWGLHAHAEQMLESKASLVSFFTDDVSDTLTELTESETDNNYGKDIIQNLSEIQLGAKAYALAASQAEIDNPHNLTADGDSGSMNFSSAIARGDFLSNNDIAAMKLFLNSSKFYSQPTTETDSYALQLEGGDDIIVVAVGIPIGMTRALEYPELDVVSGDDADSIDEETALATLSTLASISSGITTPATYRSQTRKVMRVVIDIQNLQYPTLIFDSKSFVFDPRLFLSPYCWDQVNDILAIASEEGLAEAEWGATLSDSVSSWASMWGEFDVEDGDGYGDSTKLETESVAAVMPFYMATINEEIPTLGEGSDSSMWPHASFLMDGAYASWWESALGDVALTHQGSHLGGSLSLTEMVWQERYGKDNDNIERVTYNHAVDDVLKKYYKFTYGIDFSESGFPSSREFNKTLVDEAISSTAQDIWEGAGTVPTTADGEAVPYASVVGDASAGYHEVMSFSSFAESDLAGSISSSEFAFIRNLLSSKLYCPEASARNALSAKAYERTFLIPVDPSTFIVNMEKSTIENDDGTTLEANDIVPDHLRNEGDGDTTVQDSNGEESFTIASSPTSFYTITATVKLENWS